MQSFKLVEYIRNIHKFNIVKIENDEFRYKLKAYNLITKKGKIHMDWYRSTRGRTNVYALTDLTLGGLWTGMKDHTM
jgi:hypothetical protein